MILSCKNLRLQIITDPRVLLILLAVCEKNIVRYVLLLPTIILGTSIPSTILLHLLYCVLIIKCFREHNIRIYLKEIVVILFVLLAITFSCLLYAENSKYIFDGNNIWNTIFPCLRYFIVGLVFIADEDTMDLVGKASYLAIVVELLCVLFYMMPRGLMGSDDMSRSYQLLPNVLFALNYAFNNKKFYLWVVPIIGILYLLSMGSRGPVIVTIVYIVLKFIKDSSSQNIGKVLVLTVIGIAVIVFFNSDLYTDALITLRNLLAQFGVSTRVLDLAIVGETVSHDSGRNDIYALLLSKLAEHPLKGYGVYGEWQWIGWSAHNLYLEIMIHFGIPMGIFVLLWIVKTIFGTYFKTSNTHAKDFILIWICYIFIRGFFGGAYLEYGMAFAIGFCINEHRQVKMRSKYAPI